MKRTLPFCMLLFTGICSQAANVFTVQATNSGGNRFIPTNIPNVQVGDTVRFQFVAGFHNAISAAGAVPAGAAPINSGGPSNTVRTYDYVPQVVGSYRYYCEVHSGDQGATGMFATFTVSGSTPVKLTGLFVQATGAKGASVGWKTASEQNASHFIVRRSIDGFTFTDIGRVNAAGNSTTERSYSFTDENPPLSSKYVYYNLSTVDKDGTYEISTTVLFKNEKGQPKLVLQLAPNPVPNPGFMSILFNADKGGKLQVELYNMAGQKVRTTGILADQAGIINGHIHIGEQPAGAYNLVFTLDGKKEVHKIIIK